MVKSRSPSVHFKKSRKIPSDAECVKRKTHGRCKATTKRNTECKNCGKYKCHNNSVCGLHKWSFVSSSKQRLAGVRKKSRKSPSNDHCLKRKTLGRCEALKKDGKRCMQCARYTKKGIKVCGAHKTHGFISHI